MSEVRVEEVLLSAVASVLDQLGILQLPEGRIKRSRVCSASVAMTGVKPLPSTQRLSAASQIGLNPSEHCSSLLEEQSPPEKLIQQPFHAFLQPSLFSFTPAVLGGRTSKPVYCRPLSNNDLSLPRKKRLLRRSPSEAEADHVHPPDVGTVQHPPLPDNVLCSTLQENELEYNETLQDNSAGSEDQLVHLDLSFQDVFVEEEEVDAGSYSMCERSVLDEGGSAERGQCAMKRIVKELLDESNNVQTDLTAKPLEAKENSAQQAAGEEEEGCVGLELSLGSDFSERHGVKSLGLNRSGYHGDMLTPKTEVVKHNKEEVEDRPGEASVRERVSAILKGWVNPQFAPHSSPLKLRQLPGLDTECQITSSQLKDALFIGQVPLFGL